MPTAMLPLLLKGLVNDSPSIWCSLLMSPNWPAISSECTHEQRRIKTNLTTRFANFFWKWTHAGTKSVWHGLLKKNGSCTIYFWLLTPFSWIGTRDLDFAHSTTPSWIFFSVNQQGPFEQPLFFGWIWIRPISYLKTCTWITFHHFFPCFFIWLAISCNTGVIILVPLLCLLRVD